MIRAVVPLSRQSSTLFKGRLKARLALSRSLRIGSQGSACLQLAYRYCFHLVLRYRTSFSSSSIFCLVNCPQSASTLPLAYSIQKSQSFGSYPSLHAVISFSNQSTSLLISLSGAPLLTASTSLAYICSERKAGRFSTASLSLATLLLAISIFASQCLGKRLRVSLLRMERQYESPWIYSREMNQRSCESYMLSIWINQLYLIINNSLGCGQERAGIVQSECGTDNRGSKDKTSRGN